MGIKTRITDALSAFMGTDRSGSAKPAKPKPGEFTGPQNANGGLPLLFGGMPFPGMGAAAAVGAYGEAGGSFLPGVGPFAGLGMPAISIAFGGYGMFGWGPNGFVQPRKGSYVTYRLMDHYPTLRLVRALIVAPIVTSQWTVRVEDWAKDNPALSGKLDEAQRRIADLLKLRGPYIKEAVRYLSSGWRPFEIVWNTSGDGYQVDRLKPMLPDLSAIITDQGGNFAGLSQGSTTNRMGIEKSHIVTWDGEAGNLYGFSRHEAAYDFWIDAIATRLRGALLEAKLSGRLPILHYPPGKTVVNGKSTDNAVVARQILSTLGVGDGAALPSIPYEVSELAQNPEIAKTTIWNLEFEDAGSHAPAVAGNIARQEYHDKMLVRAWCWPERAVLEAQHGTRADAHQHTDTASTDREVVDDDIADQFNRQVTDSVLAFNLGDEYRGAVTVQPAPLVDSKVEIYTQILEAMAQDKTVGPELYAAMNVEEMLDHLDVAMNDEAKLNDRLGQLAERNAEAQMQAAAAQGQQPGGDQGDGTESKQSNGQRPKAAELLSRWLDLKDN